MDYAVFHKKEPLSPNLATMIPNNASKSNMFHLFYGIDMNISQAKVLSAQGQIEKNGITWKVGIANNTLSIYR